ncbi:GGDEF domain-containing protein [Patescibacteria group bacterium]
MIKRIKAAMIAFRHPNVLEKEDILTESQTRAKFISLSEREIARAKRGQPLSLVFVDLDGLKEINDTQGHKKGDEYIKNFGLAVMSIIRPYDVFCRWGGDEFVLLLSGANSKVSEKVIRRIQDSFPYFSWGVSSWIKGATLESLLQNADAKMYQQKQKKK